MSDPERLHTVTFRINGGGVYPVVSCPYEAEDQTRPCWPSDENGEPIPGDDYCNYAEWVSNDDLDAIVDVDLGPFPIEAVWHGDYFTFEVLP